MPVVSFPRLFVHRRTADLDEWRAYYVRDGGRTLKVDAVREVYGAGNTGVVRSPRRTDDLAFDLVEIPRADEQWWRDGAGQLHLWRDPRGRLHWGFYDEFGPDELPGEGSTFDLSLAVFVVTAPAPLEADE